MRVGWGRVAVRRGEEAKLDINCKVQVAPSWGADSPLLRLGHGESLARPERPPHLGLWCHLGVAGTQLRGCDLRSASRKVVMVETLGPGKGVPWAALQDSPAARGCLGALTGRG